MIVSTALGCVAGFLNVAVSALVPGRAHTATALVYVACLVLALAAFTNVLAALVTGADSSAVTPPLGLPWIGAHFRVDPLAAFFLAVVDLRAPAPFIFSWRASARSRCFSPSD